MREATLSAPGRSDAAIVGAAIAVRTRSMPRLAGPLGAGRSSVSGTPATAVVTNGPHGPADTRALQRAGRRGAWLGAREAHAGVGVDQRISLRIHASGFSGMRGCSRRSTWARSLVGRGGTLSR